jgi:hypothetical protein
MQTINQVQKTVAPNALTLSLATYIAFISINMNLINFTVAFESIITALPVLDKFSKLYLT